VRLENCVKEDGLWVIDAEQARHLVSVRRCYSGSLVEGLIDGEKAELRLICEGNTVRAEELSRIKEPEPHPRITLLLAVLKSDQFDTALRTCAEVGVSDIRLLDCERSVPKFGGARLGGKMERWRRILFEATKQAGSSRAPEIEAPVSLSDLDFGSLPETRYAAMLSDRAVPLKGLPQSDSLAVAIGPEGDWSPEEGTLLLDRGFAPVTLGRRILRASTAVAAAASWFMLNGG
jgi:16S rRNA (uracil1498-N3)-methyltransferase